MFGIFLGVVGGFFFSGVVGSCCLLVASLVAFGVGGIGGFVGRLFGGIFGWVGGWLWVFRIVHKF